MVAQIKAILTSRTGLGILLVAILGAFIVACSGGDGEDTAAPTPGSPTATAIPGMTALGEPRIALDAVPDDGEPCQKLDLEREVSADEPFDVDICVLNIDEKAGLSGFSFDLHYPEDLLQGAGGVNAIVTGDAVKEMVCFINDDRFATETPADPATPPNDGGRTFARAVCSLFPLPSVGPRGSFKAATVRLAPQGKGEAQLSMTDVALYEASEGRCLYYDRGCDFRAPDAAPDPAVITIR